MEIHKQSNELESSIPRGEETTLIRAFARPGESFASESEMRSWLEDKGIDLKAADARKGLTKLYEKIEKGEARLIYDSDSDRVIRAARVAKIGVQATFGDRQYPMIELCQVFLAEKIDEEALRTTDPVQIAKALRSLKIRSAQVRDSQQLWETLVEDEDAELGVERGLEEELGLTACEASLASITMLDTSLEYEAPIDWPGIHSVLEVNSAMAVLPEEISRAAYAEIELGDQVTFFVAMPDAPVLQALLGQIIPNIQYVPPDSN